MFLIISSFLILKLHVAFSYILYHNAINSPTKLNNALNGENKEFEAIPGISFLKTDSSNNRIMSYASKYDRQRFACRIMYDGTGFRGWQQQEAKMRTVQGIISKRLTQRFDTNMKVTGAGRTDQGVHARGQAGHFDVPYDKANEVVHDPSHLEFVLNRLLPDDVRIYNIQPMKEFHATGFANSKLYVYRFCVNKFVDPLRKRYCTHVYNKLDMQLFHDCLQMFIGTHDFKAFANRIAHTNKDLLQFGHTVDTNRTIQSINIIDEGDGYFRVEFRLKSALYRMVRNIMGASLAVAAGHLPFSKVEELLKQSRDRDDLKARSAPPEGLTLEYVYYTNYD